jgi:hypothetical protein
MPCKSKQVLVQLLRVQEANLAHQISKAPVLLVTLDIRSHRIDASRVAPAEAGCQGPAQLLRKASVTMAALSAAICLKTKNVNG